MRFLVEKMSLYMCIRNIYVSRSPQSLKYEKVYAYKFMIFDNR